jgi:REG-2-like HAD superfamily hydrolase
VRAAAITFDVTGTLLHSPRLAAIYAEVLARHGITASADELATLVPRVWQELACRVEMGEDRFRSHPEGARGWWARFLARIGEYLGAPAPSPFAAAELYARFAHAEAWEVYPEVPAILAELRRRGHALAVIANWDDRLPRLLAELDLARLFDAVVYSAEVGVEKPHPRIFRRALGELGVDAGAAIHVGDRLREDVEGAVAVGMEALLLVRRPGAGPPPEGRAPGDLPDLTPLPDIVEVPPPPDPAARARRQRRGRR